jgi:hypothetical protein
MADLTDQQRDQNRTRQLRKHQRRAARDLARDRAHFALNQVLGHASPEWFTPEQERAYGAEIQRLRDRIGEPRPTRQCGEAAPSLARGRA